MTRSAQETAPSSIEDFVRAVREVDDLRAPVVATSALSFGSPLMSRVGVFEFGGAFPQLLHQGFVDVTQVDAARAALGGAKGGWDAFFATGWSWVWREEPFEIWREASSRVALVRDRTLVTAEKVLEASDLEQIELCASRTMVDRVLRATRFGHAPVTLIAVEDFTPSVDPAYDREQLDTDTLWMQVLGRRLAEALGKRFVCHL